MSYKFRHTSFKISRAVRAAHPVSVAVETVKNDHERIGRKSRISRTVAYHSESTGGYDKVIAAVNRYHRIPVKVHDTKSAVLLSDKKEYPAVRPVAAEFVSRTYAAHAEFRTCVGYEF